MFAKVAVLFAAIAAVQASGLVGYGTPLLTGGHLGTVSAQSTAINHVAPVGYAGGLGYGHGIAAAPLAYGLRGYGLAAGPLGYGHGLAVGPLGYGHGLAAGPLAYGHGLVGARYGGVLGLGHGVGLGKALL